VLPMPVPSRSRARRHHAKVEYPLRTRRGSRPSRTAAVDLATAAQAAHWFDCPAYYAEVRRVTGRRGSFALVSYGVLGRTPMSTGSSSPFTGLRWLPTGRPSAGMWTRVIARCPSRSRSSRLRARDPARLAARGARRLCGDVVCGVGARAGEKARGRSRRSAASWRRLGGQPRRYVPCAGPSLSALVACDATFDYFLETSQELEQGDARARRQARKAIAGSFSLAGVSEDRRIQVVARPSCNSSGRVRTPHRGAVRICGRWPSPARSRRRDRPCCGAGNRNTAETLCWTAPPQGCAP